jgi:hypothetical protein
MEMINFDNQTQTENEKSDVWQRNGQNAELVIQDDGFHV